MIVVVHQAVGMAEPAVAAEDMGKTPKEHGSILIVRHDVLPSIASAGNVIDSTGECKTEWASHGAGE
ncbi:MAG: hypothetical protein ACREJN_08240 [Nitrospiraceae bacterium]